jgi:uncharacterized heparinase superfamily protein
MKLFFLYFNTIKRLKLIQIFYRFLYFFYIPKFKIINTPISIKKRDKWIFSIRKKDSINNENNFYILNNIIEYKNKKNWESKTIDKLLLYHIHYFDYINFGQNNNKVQLHTNLINEYINYKKNLKFVGLDPYPVSLRIVNWIKWSIENNYSEKLFLKTIISEAHYLSKRIEWHILGNHLFKNAKALIFAGLFFSNNIVAKKLYYKGIKIIKKELKVQVLDDGGHFERSPMYHAIFLEDLLDIVNIHNSMNLDVPIFLDNLIKKMFEWLDLMTHEDNTLSHFNDTTNNFAPSIIELKEYANKLNYKIITKRKVFSDLSYSGFSRVNFANYSAIINRGNPGPDYLLGHAHADALSFELSILKKKFIVNQGISTYENIKKRLLQKATESHSTLEIDRANSSEIWSSFRVANRSKIIKKENHINENNILLTGSHDGYKNLKGSPIYKREFLFKNNEIIINDIIDGLGLHLLNFYYFLHPDIKINNINNVNKIIEFIIKNKKIILKFDPKCHLSITEDSYCLEFYKEIKNIKISFATKKKLPIRIVTKIYILNNDR